MRILIIGGTRFIGPRVAAQLLAGGHEVSLFHRAQTEADLPIAVNHIYGDRRELLSFKSQFGILTPDVVVDMICHNKREASGLMRTFEGVAGRVVVIGSRMSVDYESTHEQAGSLRHSRLIILAR